MRFIRAILEQEKKKDLESMVSMLEKQLTIMIKTCDLSTEAGKEWVHSVAEIYAKRMMEGYYAN